MRRRNDREVDRFLDFLTSSVPGIEPTPFFAPRTAAIAVSRHPSFLNWLEIMARRLVPAFLLLMIATTLLLYRFAAPLPDPAETELLFEALTPSEAMTAEQVLSELGSL